MTSFMISEELDSKIKDLIKLYKSKGIFKYSSKADFIREAIIEQYFKEIELLNKEPTKNIPKKIKELVDIAYANGDLDSLHETLVLVKDRYNKLISR